MEGIRDDGQWDDDTAVMLTERRLLRATEERWDDVVGFLNGDET